MTALEILTANATRRANATYDGMTLKTRDDIAEHNPRVALALGLLATIRAPDLLLTEDLAAPPIAGAGWSITR